MIKQFHEYSHTVKRCLVRFRVSTNWRPVSLFATALLISHATLAQIKITLPVSRQIVQRNNNNQATVQIAGSYGQPLETVEARAVARAAGQGTTSDWTALQTNPSNGQFSGTMTIAGGWYTIEVRGKSGGTVVATDALDRFGVGEVFAIMGHSNAQGSGCTVNGENKCPSLDGASDDRVNVVAIDQNSDAFNQYLSKFDETNTADSRYLPGLVFSKLTSSSGMAPFAKMPWLWGPMGDRLVARLNVPVLLYNAGFGGTNMQQTYWAAYDIPFDHSFVRFEYRMPYANVRNLMNLYVPTTGIRAILVQHGANDRNNPTDSTAKYYRGVIDKIRTEFRKPDLKFIVALDSYLFAPNDNVRAAQFQIINPGGYGTYLGPDLDQISGYDPFSGEAYRPDNTHFSPSGQRRAGQMWADAITDNYLSVIPPYPAETEPLTNISCAPNNQLALSKPDGFAQAIWQNTATTSVPLSSLTASAANITVGAGTYSTRLIDAQHKALFPPAVVVPASVQPPKPTISSPNGSLVICQSTGLLLTSSYAGPNYWSTGNSASSVAVTTPGTYTVQAKNAVYGCLSEATSSKVSMAAIDLDLVLQPSRKVVAINDTVTYQLTLKNTGGCDAGRATVENRLPPNMAIVSTSGGLSLANADIYGNKMVVGLFKQVPAGQSVSYTYQTRLLAAGTYVNAAEVMWTLNPSVRTSSGNGTDNGEEDEARTDLRTTNDAPAVFISPNPNQEPPTPPNEPAPSSNEADLSLLMRSSSRTATVGNTVSFTITVSNRGALTATNVSLINVLPAGLQFLKSVSGINPNGNFLSIGISEIRAGQSVSLEYTVRALAEGTFVNKAQIDSSDQPDSDSTPNNGYANGEDDQTSLTLQVTN